MISFLSLGRFGQLGNQMFEISALIGCAYNYNDDYIINWWKYNKYLKDELPTGTNNSYVTYREQTFHYTPIKLNRNKNWDIKGYFQSEKYWENIKEIIKSKFELKDEYIQYIINKYPFLKNDKTCSIHVRRTDFLKLLEYHVVQPLDYYKKAIEILYPNIEDRNSINFIICSDDIDWCKENLKLDAKMIFIEGEEDIIDMNIISMCDNNINASSSFSWWGSYLNKNENKKIIVPKKWFGPKYENLITNDLIPNSWIII